RLQPFELPAPDTRSDDDRSSLHCRVCEMDRIGGNRVDMNSGTDFNATCETRLANRIQQTARCDRPLGWHKKRVHNRYSNERIHFCHLVAQQEGNSIVRLTLPLIELTKLRHHVLREVECR